MKFTKKLPNKSYVEFNKWTGKIKTISGNPLLPTTSDSIIREMNSKIIMDIFLDKRSLESAGVVINNKTQKYECNSKKGIIYLPNAEDKFSIIGTEKIDKPDVTLNLFTNNKLLNIIINHSAIKTWYNHRMKKNFQFSHISIFMFQIKDKQGKLLKNISLSSNDFLEIFHTTIDLSDIEDLKNIEIFTRRIFKTYTLNIKKDRYFQEDLSNIIKFKKVHSKKINETYDITIFPTDKERTIMIKNNIDKKKLNPIHKKISFYITGKDPNELYDIVEIDLKTLHEKRSFIIELKYEIKDKIIWNSNNNITAYFNKRIMKI